MATAVRVVEHLARPALAEAPARLQIEVLGRDRAVVWLEGNRALTLSRRQSEVLVLLGASTSGLSGEQLAIAM